MTTGVVCGAAIKSKHRLYRGQEPCRIMDPQFMQLESQLAALRNQRHPVAGTRLTSDVPPLATKLSPSPAPSPRHDVPRKSDPRGLASSSLSSVSPLSSTSSSALSQDVPVLRAAASVSSPSSSSPSSSSSVDSATAAEKRDGRDSLSRSQQSLTSVASELTTAWRRSVPSINEERSRFRIVKIDTYVDRGRWHCHNFADPPLHDADIGCSAQDDSGAGAVGDDDDSAPSQIYYIAAGQNDGDLSKKFYVSTIVYGEHGHPVLDRTVRMSPLQLLRRASDIELSPTDAGETLTPSPRGNDSNLSLAETPVNDTDDTDNTLLRTFGDCSHVLPVNDDDGHVASAPESTDVMEIDAANPFAGVAMAAHNSMPSILTSSSSPSITTVSGYDDVSRRPVTSLPHCQQDDVEIHSHNDDHGQPACPTLQLLSADDGHATRFAL